MTPDLMTTEEIREAFLDEVRSMIIYWDKVAVSSTRDRLDGLAHSILVMLDGNYAKLPPFIVIPHITTDDKISAVMDRDIAGTLHEQLFRKVESKETRVEKILQHVKNLRDNYNFPAGIDALIKAYGEYERASCGTGDKPT